MNSFATAADFVRTSFLSVIILLLLLLFCLILTLSYKYLPIIIIFFFVILISISMLHLLYFVVSHGNSAVSVPDLFTFWSRFYKTIASERHYCDGGVSLPSWFWISTNRYIVLIFLYFLLTVNKRFYLFICTHIHSRCVIIITHLFFEFCPFTADAVNSIFTQLKKKIEFSVDVFLLFLLVLLI